MINGTKKSNSGKIIFGSIHGVCDVFMVVGKIGRFGRDFQAQENYQLNGNLHEIVVVQF
jgi:hypothetical protein